MSTIKSEKVIKGIQGLTNEELLEVLRNSEVQDRMRALRPSGQQLRSGEFISDGEKTCVRCNRGIPQGKRGRSVDEMVFGVECAGKYETEKATGKYEGLEGAKLSEAVLANYKTGMSQKMKERGGFFGL